VEAGQWCAVAHVDIAPGEAVETAEQGFGGFVDASDAAPGTIARSVVRLIRRPNHFEVIGRFVSEDAYVSHLVTPSRSSLNADCRVVEHRLTIQGRDYRRFRQSRPGRAGG
jgi:quinol monooxygenase YgiN